MIVPFKNNVQKNFSKAANLYDSYACAQNQAAVSLVKALSNITHDLDFQHHPNHPQKNHNTILDLGAGTGALTYYMQQYLSFLDSSYVLMDISLPMLQTARNKLNHMDDIHFVVGDMDVPCGNFDTIISSFSFQWSSAPQKLLKNWWDRTNCIAFSVPILGSFDNIQKIFEEFNIPSTLLPLMSQETWEKYCLDLPNVKIAHKHVYMIEECYPSLWDFLRYLKCIGAQTSATHHHFSHMQKLKKNPQKIFCNYNILEMILIKNPY